MRTTFFLTGAFTCALWAACSANPDNPNDGTDALDGGVRDANFDSAIGAALPPEDSSGCLAIDGSAPEPPLAVEGMPLTSGSLQQDKNFYLLTLLEAYPTVQAALTGDAAVAALAKGRDAAFRTAVASCGTQSACYATALRFTSGDSTAAGQAIVSALSGAGLVAPLAANHLRPSGQFNLHFAQSDSELLASAWTDSIVALNSAFDGYVATLDAATLQSVMSGVLAAHAESMPVWKPLLAVVLAALSAQQRDEATRFEPLEAGENSAALARIRGTDFSRFPYSVILVPGEGPTDLTTPLDPTGQLRCDLAVERYKAGRAPFLFVSGGYVHPDRTHFCEAIQMKHYLMTQKGIAEDAILVDPHARHTTTNLRNVTRLLLRYGIPAERPILITSDMLQSAYIDLPELGFWDRCDMELFYRPWRAMTRLTDNDSCMMPSTMTLYVSGLDPLDP